MRRSLVVIAVLIFFSFTARGHSTDTATTKGFRWLDASKDAALFGQIKGAFAEELKPDDPEKVKPVVAQLYKKISRVGIVESSVLVLIAERETESSKYGDYLQPFNYDLKTGKKQAFEKGFTRWRFREFAHFSTDTMPDIVFTYLSCTECEATYLLGSFRFDPHGHSWGIRRWGKGENDDAILIGSDTVVGGEEGDYDYQCVFKIAEFNRDGLDDVCVRCQAVGEDKKILEDLTLLYSIQKGQPVIDTITDRGRVALLTARLCEGVTKARLCQPN